MDLPNPPRLTVCQPSLPASMSASEPARVSGPSEPGERPLGAVRRLACEPGLDDDASEPISRSLAFAIDGPVSLQRSPHATSSPLLEDPSGLISYSLQSTIHHPPPRLPTMSTPNPSPTHPTPIPALFSLAHKNVLITGASRGIGAACARALAAAGARVALVYRRGSTDLSTYEEIIAASGSESGEDARKENVPKALVLECNLDDMEDVKTLFPRALEAFGWTAESGGDGGIHVLVNCAGIQRRAPSVEFREGDWDDVSVLCLLAFGFWGLGVWVLVFGFLVFWCLEFRVDLVLCCTGVALFELLAFVRSVLEFFGVLWCWLRCPAPADHRDSFVSLNSFVSSNSWMAHSHSISDFVRSMDSLP